MTPKTPRKHLIERLPFRSFTTGESGKTTFVLIHGIGMSHRYLTPLHDVLADGARVHSIDLPGFGGVTKPRRTPDIGEMADAVGAVLDELGVGTAVLVGHSMGAQWVIELALRRPDLAEGVVAFSAVTDMARRSTLTQALLLGRDSALEPPHLNALTLRDYLRCGPSWYAPSASYVAVPH